MEKFIEKTFKRLLHKDVRVFLGQDDPYTDVQMESYRIYVISSQNKDYLDSEFCETYPEFSVFQIHESKKWGYDILTQTFAGDYWTAPDWDYVESDKNYKCINAALFGLIQEIIKEDWNDLLMCEEEAKYND